MSIDSDVALSIHSYYSGEIETGLRACERLLNSTADGHIKNNALTNRLFYMQPLSELINVKYIKIDTKPLSDGWVCTNPSIMKYKGGYALIVRNVNYRIESGRYIINDSSSIIRTKNKLLILDHSLNIISEHPLEDPSYPKGNYPVDNIEDSRIFGVGDKIFLSSTIRNHVEYDGAAKICTVSINDHKSMYLEVCDGAGVSHIEKNWMPIMDEPFTWLYMSGPDTKLISKTGNYSPVTTGHSLPITYHFRGGSQLVPFNGGYTCIIHEVGMMGGLRVYSHRFVEFDRSKNIYRMSKPFYIKKSHTIEFAAGMCLDQQGRNFLVTFGLEDKEPWIVKVNVNEYSKLF